MTAGREPKNVLRHLACVLAAVSLCGAASGAQPRDYVRIVGSSTLFPFSATVAETFGKSGRWKAPVVESVGTGGGFKLFCSGVGVATPDIIDASRAMTAAEQAECIRNGVGKVIDIRVGLDGMLIANARNSPVFSLTREQLFLAVAKTVPSKRGLIPNPYRRWNEISPRLPDLPIVIYGPAANHGTRDAFVALAMEPVCANFPEIKALAQADRKALCQSVREDGAWIDVNGDYALLYSRLLVNPRAVGVLGYSYLERNRDRIKAARIDGVLPTAESISASTYPLSRPLSIYVKEAHVGHIPGLAQFLQEFFSDRAIGLQGYLTEQGLMPLPDNQLQAERLKVQQLLQRTGPVH
jgi:phosphate transport system substrate-binding protein